MDDLEEMFEEYEELIDERNELEIELIDIDGDISEKQYEIDDYDSESSDVEYEINSLNEDISMLKNEIQSLKEEIASIQVEIKEKNEEVKELKSDLSSRKEEKKLLTSEMNSLKKDRASIEAKMKRINEKIVKSDLHQLKLSILNTENQYCVSLSKDTKTIEMLDDFIQSKKKYLILENQFYLPHRKKRAALVLSEAFLDDDFDYYYDKPTLTELKLSCGMNINHVSESRLSYINHQLSNIDKYDLLLKEDGVYILNSLRLVGGQTKTTGKIY